MPRSAQILRAVGDELKTNPPSVLAKTRRARGLKAAEAQRRAILLSKARAAGARIPNG